MWMTASNLLQQKEKRFRCFFCFVCIKAEHIFHVHWPCFEFLRYVWGPEAGGTARLQSQGEGGAANPHRPVPQGFEPWTFGSKVQYPTPELPAPQIQMLKDLQQLCAMGGFRLSKVISDRRTVLSAIPIADRSKQIKTLDIKQEKLLPERALGIFWHVEEDFFGFDVDITRLLETPPTRRNILSAVASIYDPLGLAAPLIMTAQILLQELNRLHIGWDQEVPFSNRRAWDNWLRHLPLLSKFRVRRCFKSPTLGAVEVVELHHFADASEKGYGTASYMRLIDSKGELNACCSEANPGWHQQKASPYQGPITTGWTKFSTKLY